jgi:Tol biopolymer transport system component
MVILVIVVVLIMIIAMMQFIGAPQNRTVPHEESYGIYSLDLVSKAVALIYTSANMLQGLSLNSAGNTLAFSERLGGADSTNEEICKVDVGGTGFSRLTDNSKLDTYPAWSADGSLLYFLSWRDTDLDIYKMGSDGGNQIKFYDSGYNDADMNVVGSKMVFTRQSEVWRINTDATGATKITDPPRAGEWGNANLPFGDYDPRLSPDGSKIVFERLVGDTSTHGNYNLYSIGTDGTGETPLTATGYSQGLPSWSHSGNRIIYIVAAINDAGTFRIYMMDSNGGNNRDITPDFFPDDFLCQSAVFSHDDSKVYFIGQWY